MPASSVSRDEAVTDDPRAAGLQTCGRLLVGSEWITEGVVGSAAERARVEAGEEGRCDQHGNRHWLRDRAERGATADYAPAKSYLRPTAMTVFPRHGQRFACTPVIRAAAVADTANCADAAAPHTQGWRQGELTAQHAVKSRKLLNVLTAARSYPRSVWLTDVSHVMSSKSTREGAPAFTLISLTTCFESDLQNMPLWRQYRSRHLPHISSVLRNEL